ncbi:MAG: hypothetical protein ACLUTA_04635 [Blautia wexlerae]
MEEISLSRTHEEADGCLYQVKRTFKGSYHISDRADCKGRLGKFL